MSTTATTVGVHIHICEKCGEPFECYATCNGDGSCWKHCYTCHLKMTYVPPTEWRKHALEAGNV
jgi:hypothetical protein